MAYLYAADTLSGFTGRDFTMMTEMGLEAVPEAYRMRSTLTISSLGKGADSVWSGVTFGLYVYQGEEEGAEVYRQHDTVARRSSQLCYISRGPDHHWRVGWTVGGQEGFLHHQATAFSPLSSGFGVD